MKIVVDVNVILSSLLKEGRPFEVFSINSLLNKFDFVAPEFLLTELEKHKERIFKISRLSRGIFNDTLRFIIEQITFVPKSDFLECIDEAKRILADHLKDAPYLALALKLDCPIFSGDKSFKALCPEKVLSPTEMFDKF
ncbi:MAG: PIN domain-containing protein [Nanoarchaeota archaeon]